MSDRLLLEQRLLELYVQLSHEDQQVLVAMVESALLVGRLVEDGDPEVAGFDARLSSLFPSVGSMSEMSDMTSLRLQMAMDRRSKFLSTLSNVEKKMSATSQGITQNLK